MHNLYCNQTLQQEVASNRLEHRRLHIHYNYTIEIDRMLHAAISNVIATRYPMQKILRQVAKLLLINVFEASLLHWMLKSSALLKDSNQETYQQVMRELNKYDDFTFEDPEYTRVFLNTLLNGYYVKTFVNTADDLVELKKGLAMMAPSFISCYDYWNKEQSLKSLSLPVINEIFRKCSRTKLNEDLQLNYNAIVDQILDMAKPYNTSWKEKEPSIVLDEDQESVVQAKPLKNKPVEQVDSKKKKGKKQKTAKEQNDKKTLKSSGKSFAKPNIVSSPNRNLSRSPMKNPSPSSNMLQSRVMGNQSVLRRSTRQREHWISSQQQDFDWLGRRTFNQSYRAGGMFDSIRSLDMKPDMLKSVDSNWGDNLLRMEMKRNTLNDSGYQQREKAETQPSHPLANSKNRNSMLASKQPQQQPQLPDLSLRKVDSEEIDN